MQRGKKAPGRFDGHYGAPATVLALLVHCDPSAGVALVQLPSVDRGSPCWRVEVDAHAAALRALCDARAVACLELCRGRATDGRVGRAGCGSALFAVVNDFANTARLNGTWEALRGEATQSMHGPVVVFACEHPWSFDERCVSLDAWVDATGERHAPGAWV